MRYFLILFYILFCGYIAKAQISVSGIPFSFSSPQKIGKEFILALPAFNFDSLENVEINNTNLQTKRLRFGYNFEVNYNTNNSGHWSVLSNGGRYWQLCILSAKAKSLGINFSSYQLPVGARLYIFNITHSEILGAFTDANNKSWGGLAVAPIFSDTIIIELDLPAGVEMELPLCIGQVSHGFKNIKMMYQTTLKDFNQSGSCNININCPEASPWRYEKKSVAMIISNGSWLASGALINNVRNDGTPYFLTANHCYDPYLKNWIFVFNYESPSCANINGSLLNSVSGATLLANQPDVDFMLIKLAETPPPAYDVYYAGWDRSGDIPSSVVAIHHPTGDIKKIAFDDNAPVSSKGLTNFADFYWQILKWDRNTTTEVGSSGSPLFDNMHHIIGQLYGGYSVCGNNVNDYFGKLSVSWNNGLNDAVRLKDWLDPDITNTLSINGFYPKYPNAVLVDFVTNKTIAKIDSAVSFLPFTESGTVKTYRWDFGDGSISLLRNPIHSYMAKGNYTIRLIATDSVTSDTIVKTNYLTISDSVSGIEEVGAIKGIKIGPNPTNGSFSLFYDPLLSGNYVEIRIYNTLGNVVYANRGVLPEGGVLNLNTEVLTNGFYVAEIGYLGILENLRLIINR